MLTINSTWPWDVGLTDQRHTSEKHQSKRIGMNWSWDDNSPESSIQSVILCDRITRSAIHSIWHLATRSTTTCLNRELFTNVVILLSANRVASCALAPSLRLWDNFHTCAQFLHMRKENGDIDPLLVLYYWKLLLFNVRKEHSRGFDIIECFDWRARRSKCSEMGTSTMIYAAVRQRSTPFQLAYDPSSLRTCPSRDHGFH